MKLTDIKPFTLARYSVDVSWNYLEEWLGRHNTELNPDFQREFVWSEDKQIAYVEYALRRGGVSGRDLYWNSVGWNEGENNPLIIVDGKQRLHAVRKFLNNKLPAYGLLLSEFEDKLRGFEPSFRMHVNDLTSKTEILQWYIDINAGGVTHSEKELNKVRKLLEKEKANETS